MSDRFHQPETTAPNDPRRIFIPSPPGAPPGSERSPQPRPAPGPGGRGPGGPPDPYRQRPQPGPGRAGDGGAPPPPSSPRRRRPRFTRLLLLLPVLLVLALLAGFLWARSVFNGIERVQTEETLADGGAGSGTNYLMVGSDSREGVEGGGFTDGQLPGGQRSDTMVVLHVGGDGTKILSVPRDLYVPIAGQDDSSKINAAFNGGAPRLIRTVSESLDIPIHRYVEVDFQSFAGMVDGLGGITIDFPHPATDANSGLNITESGPVELDGEQALAYVRSRHYTEHIDGQLVEDRTGDLGRIQRQQRFLSAVFGKLSGTTNPWTLGQTFSGVAEGLRIDDEMGLMDALRLAWTLRSGLNPEPLTLPTTPDRNASGAVLLLQEEAAQPVLDQLR